MPYTHATLSDATAALSTRLYGSSLWSTVELQNLIIEALRTWNSYTAFWRGDFVFPLVLDTWWYDLTVQTQSPRPITLTDFDLLASINYHLLEPNIAAYPLVWSGSTQFALADILGAIQRKQDELLSISGCNLSVASYPAVPGLIYVADNTIDIRRVSWQPISTSGYLNRTLRSSDPWAKQSFDYNYTTAGQRPPDNYLQSTQPPLSFIVDSTPPCTGQYEVLSVNSGPALTTLASHALQIPDDWTWVLKFGALANLFARESSSKDIIRAEYCERRFQEGAALLANAPSLLALRINNIPIQVDSVRNGDDFNSSWQSKAHANPTSGYSAGLNLVGFGPKPDSSTAYSATATVVENCPVPILSSDYIELSHEDYNTVLDYAQHLAMIKVGGIEFALTVPLYQQFIKQASLYNSKLSEFGVYQKAIYDLGKLQEERKPRIAITTRQEVNAE